MSMAVSVTLTLPGIDKMVSWVVTLTDVDGSFFDSYFAWDWQNGVLGCDTDRCRWQFLWLLLCLGLIKWCPGSWHWQIHALRMKINCFFLLLSQWVWNFRNKSSERTEGSVNQRVRHFVWPLSWPFRICADTVWYPPAIPLLIQNMIQTQKLVSDFWYRTCNILWCAFGQRMKYLKTCHTLRFQPWSEIASVKASCGLDLV